MQQYAAYMRLALALKTHIEYEEIEKDISSKW